MQPEIVSWASPRISYLQPDEDDLPGREKVAMTMSPEQHASIEALVKAARRMTPRYFKMIV